MSEYEFTEKEIKECIGTAIDKHNSGVSLRNGKNINLVRNILSVLKKEGNSDVPVGVVINTAVGLVGPGIPKSTFNNVIMRMKKSGEILSPARGVLTIK